MAITTVIAATTDAIATRVEFNTSGLRHAVGFTASGLAGVEKITPWIGGPNGWTGIFEDGVQVFLTVTSPQISVLPGGHYGFTKDATASPTALAAIVTA